MLRTSTAALVLLSAACAPAHVQLARAPAKEAPIEERRAFYEEHRPVLMQPAKDLGVFTPQAFLELESGAHVFHPADLLPHVEEGSPTAEAARRMEGAEQAALLWRSVGLSIATLALAGAAASLLAPESERPLLAGAAPAIAALVGIPPLFFTTHYSAVAARERETAFLTYDRSLRERLALTSEGERSSPRLEEPPPLLDETPEDPVDLSLARLRAPVSSRPSP